MKYNVIDYGATADGRLCTKEIQSAIDACYLAGGGEVLIPQGEFTVAGLRLRSNVTLHLLEGAAIVGSRNPEDYFAYLDDKIEPISKEEREHKAPSVLKSEGSSVYPYSRWNNAIIRAVRAKNIAIIGERNSRIDGLDCFDEQGEESYRGPHGINIWYCENILLRGYSLYHSGNWAHAIQNSKNINVSKISVFGGHDGFDIRTTDNTLIEDCVFETGDDCIAGFDNTNVVIRRCSFNSACSLMRFGGTDVLVENCHGYAPAKYGHRYNLSDEKKRSGAPTDENCRYNCLTVFLYYCDNRARIHKTPGNIVIRNSSFDGVDAIFNLPFGHKWCSNRSLNDILFENCDFTSLHLPINIHEPEEEPLSFTLEECNISFSEDYGAAPFIRTSGYGNICLRDVNVALDTPYIETSCKSKIEIINSTQISVKTV